MHQQQCGLTLACSVRVHGDDLVLSTQGGCRLPPAKHVPICAAAARNRGESHSLSSARRAF